MKKALEARNSDSLQPLEDALDLIYYQNLVSNQPSGGADVEVYRDFVQLKVDIANIKTLLRMRHRGIGAHDELLIGGGTLSTDLLSSTQSLEDLLTSLEGSKYFELLEPHLKPDSIDLNSCVHSVSYTHLTLPTILRV